MTASGIGGAVARTIAVVALAAAAARAEGGGTPATARVALDVSFQLDPRVTRSLYLGDRWVSPPIFTSSWAPTGGSVSVRARGLARDATGRPARGAPEWSSKDPTIATVSPRRGEVVEIDVRRPGQTAILISHGGASRTLRLKTVPQGSGWRVEIAQ